jgi:hypothetical protein
MTTLRDLLNDLIIEVADEASDGGSTISEDKKEELLDEYIERVQKMLIG